MGKQVMLEVTQPFHKNGREVLYQPGERFPLDADLPDGVAVREVIADVPDGPKPPPAAKPAGKAPGR
jgi:hypothetical protein